MDNELQITNQILFNNRFYSSQRHKIDDLIRIFIRIRKWNKIMVVLDADVSILTIEHRCKYR